MEIVLFAIYGGSLLYIFLFSLVQLHLTLSYKAPSSFAKEKYELEDRENWPQVTVQLPVYNEKYVVERLLDRVAAFDYPKEKLEIQVLDDSDDETRDMVAIKVVQYQRAGLDISHVRRDERVGYKAGALQNGLAYVKGDFIAIFDADFLPDGCFLRKTLPLFGDEKTGMVQTRWGHLNGDFSILTKLQAFGLNGHFSVEQAGRNKAGSFINFNGTAGVWRKKCITDAGGWQADTLTEDLDLSYRAQIKGWKFKFLENVESPAELPVIMSALKTQQFRWNKGGAETARKNLRTVLLSPLGLKTKIHAFFHLTGSANYLFLLIASLISVPLLFIQQSHPEYNFLLQLSMLFVLGFFSISYFYWTAAKSLDSNPWKTYSKYYPLFLTFSMGMALHNGIAVLEGFLGIKTPFLRTPKFNIIDRKGSWKNSYLVEGIKPVTIFEGLLCLYFIFGIVSGFVFRNYGSILFHTMLAIGYAGVFYFSIKKY